MAGHDIVDHVAYERVRVARRPFSAFLSMFRSAAPAVAGEYGRHAQVVHHPSRATGLAAYPFRLNMYTVPPVQDITVEEFEQWALDLSLIHI